MSRNILGIQEGLPFKENFSSFKTFIFTIWKTQER